MSKLITQEKEITAPGEVLAEGMDYLPGQGTYRDNDKIRASRVGLVMVDGRAVKLIPLSGRYMPKRGDTIIARVKEILISGWMLDIDAAYHAMLSMKDGSSELTQYYTFGDHIVCKIINVTTQKLVDVTMKGPGLRKLFGGRIIHINTHKVPRVIGKKGSMVSMVKQATGSKIIVGQNGVTWIQNDDPKMELLTVETIRKIAAEAHISGLTDRIKEFLEKKTGKKLEAVTGE
jgi:exosome complex component RRP4